MIKKMPIVCDKMQMKILKMFCVKDLFIYFAIYKNKSDIFAIFCYANYNKSFYFWWVSIVDVQAKSSAWFNNFVKIIFFIFFGKLISKNWCHSAKKLFVFREFSHICDHLF